MLLVILTVNKLLKHFTKVDCKKTNKGEFRVEKFKRKCVNLYVKWEGYDSSFNSWIDRKT